MSCFGIQILWLLYSQVAHFLPPVSFVSLFSFLFFDWLHLAFITQLSLVPVSSCPHLDMPHFFFFYFHVFFQSSLHLSDFFSSFTKPIIDPVAFYNSACLPSHFPFLSCLNWAFFIPLDSLPFLFDSQSPFLPHACILPPTALITSSLVWYPSLLCCSA